MTDAQIATHKQPNYAGVFWSLFILTIFEIITANLPLVKWMIVVSLILMAIVKASLVALFYMHLKFEKWLIYVIALFPFILAVALVVMVLSDVSIK